jgi:hypothetical protein
MKGDNGSMQRLKVPWRERDSLKIRQQEEEEEEEGLQVRKLVPARWKLPVRVMNPSDRDQVRRWQPVTWSAPIDVSELQTTGTQRLCE